MGYYIQGPNNAKAAFLIENHGAKPCDRVARFADIPRGMALVCVCDNVIFDAAALIFSEDELSALTQVDDMRRKKWLVLEKSTAHELAGYVEK